MFFRLFSTAEFLLLILSAVSGSINVKDFPGLFYLAFFHDSQRGLSGTNLKRIRKKLKELPVFPALAAMNVPLSVQSDNWKNRK